MKLKKFQDLIEECLTKEELAEIEKQAVLELKGLRVKKSLSTQESVIVFRKK